jgi:chemotaxis protein histidine kinase CheA
VFVLRPAPFVGITNQDALTVVREITERMFGGTVEVKSALGTGTVVTITLPISRQRTSGDEVDVSKSLT